jgi:hypothetical protein
MIKEVGSNLTFNFDLDAKTLKTLYTILVTSHMQYTQRVSEPVVNSTFYRSPMIIPDQLEANIDRSAAKGNGAFY